MLTITVQNSRGRTAVSSFQLSFSAPLTLIKKWKCTFSGTNTNEKRHRNGDDQSAVSETLIVAGKVCKRNLNMLGLAGCPVVAKLPR